MGNIQKDRLVWIYFSLERQVYFAGETVTGNIYINCLAKRPYDTISLRLKGKEQVRWTQSQTTLLGDYVSVTYGNSRQSYFFHANLMRFENAQINQGYYIFPFTLRLPPNLPSSFEEQENNFIQYTLTAILSQQTQGQKTAQFFMRHLQIREPFRRIPQNLRQIANIESFCCGCCSSNGFTRVSFQTNVSYLTVNAPFLLRGTFDNSECQTHIYGYKIILTQTIKMVGRKMNHPLSVGPQEKSRQQNNSYPIFESDNFIPARSVRNIEHTITVPLAIVGYSAIGNIISRSYKLGLLGLVGCCRRDPQAKVQAILLSNISHPHSMDQEPQEMYRPQDFEPNINTNIERIINPPNYVYNPHNQLNLLEQRNQAEEVNIQVEMAMDPYAVQNQSQAELK